MRFHLHLGLAIALAGAFAGVSPVAHAADERAAAPALIGRAAFDAQKTAITVPFKGPAPNVTLYKLSPTHYYYEFEGARLALGGVQFQSVGNTMERFTMANRPNGAVRLSFKLLQPGTPRFAVDRRAGKIRILPLGTEVATRGVPVAAKPVAPPEGPWEQPEPLYRHQVAKVAPPVVQPDTPPSWRPVPAKTVVLPHNMTPPTIKNALRTEIGRPYLDDFHHRLVMPFHGPAPEFKVLVHQKNPRWVYLDFEQSAVKLQGDRFDSYFDDAVFDGWMLTEPAGTNKTRLYLKFKTAMPVVAQIYPESGEMWFMTPAAQKAPEAAPPAAPTDPGASTEAQAAPVAPQP